jgi:hypothetical protein
MIAQKLTRFLNLYGIPNLITHLKAPWHFSLSQMNPIHILPPFNINLIFSYARFPSIFPLLSGFSIKVLWEFLTFFSSVTCSIYLKRTLVYCHNILKSTLYEDRFYQPPVTHFLLAPNIFLRALLSEHLYIFTSLMKSDLSQPPCQTRENWATYVVKLNVAV